MGLGECSRCQSICGAGEGGPWRGGEAPGRDEGQPQPPQPLTHVLAFKDAGGPPLGLCRPTEMSKHQGQGDRYQVCATRATLEDARVHVMLSVKYLPRAKLGSPATGWSRKSKPRPGCCAYGEELAVAVFSIRSVTIFAQLRSLHRHYICTYQSNFKAIAVWPNGSFLLFKLMDFVGGG